MNLRRRINQDPIQLQLAPMIDVILFLLCFFLLTWNLARYEQDLEVRQRPGAPAGRGHHQPALGRHGRAGTDHAFPRPTATEAHRDLAGLS